MSKFDKCCICDYNEAEGSLVADAAPGSRGKVTRKSNIDGESYCEDCLKSLYEVLISGAVDEEDENTPTLS